MEVGYQGERQEDGGIWFNLNLIVRLVRARLDYHTRIFHFASHLRPAASLAAIHARYALVFEHPSRLDDDGGPGGAQTMGQSVGGLAAADDDDDF